MSDKTVCPVCGKSISLAPFKSWRFGRYVVGRYECPNCKSNFNRYDGPKGSYTIPKAK